MAGGPRGGPTAPLFTLLEYPDTNELILQWGISQTLACRLFRMARIFFNNTNRGLYVRSGYRTCAEQTELQERGRPAAPCSVSNHVRCPATAADLRIEGPIPSPRSLRIEFGKAALEAGLRWGGGSPVEDGIPSDWNHVDLGPRQ